MSDWKRELEHLLRNTEAEEFASDPAFTTADVLVVESACGWVRATLACAGDCMWTQVSLADALAAFEAEKPQLVLLGSDLTDEETEDLRVATRRKAATLRFHAVNDPPVDGVSWGRLGEMRIEVARGSRASAADPEALGLLVRRASRLARLFLQTEDTTWGALESGGYTLPVVLHAPSGRPSPLLQEVLAWQGWWNLRTTRDPLHLRSALAEAREVYPAVILDLETTGASLAALDDVADMRCRAALVCPAGPTEGVPKRMGFLSYARSARAPVALAAALEGLAMEQMAAVLEARSYPLVRFRWQPP